MKAKRVSRVIGVAIYSACGSRLSRRGHPVRRATAPVAGQGGMLPLSAAIHKQCKTYKSVTCEIHIFIQPTSQDNRLKIGKMPVCEIAPPGHRPAGVPCPCQLRVLPFQQIHVVLDSTGLKFVYLFKFKQIVFFN